MKKAMASCSDPDDGLLLHAYELHALSEEETERFEIHLLDCEYCLNEYKAFERESTLLSRNRNLHKALRRVEEDSWLKKLMSNLWPDLPLPFKPAIAYLLIILMIYPSYRGLKRYSGSEFRSVGLKGSTEYEYQSAEKSASGIRLTQMISLIPTRSSGKESFKVSAGGDGIVIFVFRDAVPGRAYKIAIQFEDGQVIFQDDNYNRFDLNETGSLLLPLDRLKAGTYTLTITDPMDEPPRNTQVYSFVIEE